MIVYREKGKDIDVYLEGKWIGEIKYLRKNTYQYWALGRRRFAGEVGTLLEVKKSLGVE